MEPILNLCLDLSQMSLVPHMCGEKQRVIASDDWKISSARSLFISFCLLKRSALYTFPRVLSKLAQKL
jgi:hypothetical protein